MKPFDMAFPETIGEVCTLLEENSEGRIVAGGTALNIVIKEGVYDPELLINIRGLSDDHSFVKDDDDVIRIGALTTLRDIEQSDIVTEYLPVANECLQEIAGVRVRNSATIGGHLAHADIHLDLPPVLAGYDAKVVISDGDETRQIHIEDFMQGYYETALGDTEIITEIVVPKPDPDLQGTYLKHRYFSEVDWPCVGVAAFGIPDGESIQDVSVLLNSVSRNPIYRVECVNEVLDGALPDSEIEEVGKMAREQVTPSDDLRGSAEYKERMAGVFTERALRKLQET